MSENSFSFYITGAPVLERQHGNLDLGREGKRQQNLGRSGQTGEVLNGEWMTN
jgi:hypothetical protein